jgi:hypothetical protein
MPDDVLVTGRTDGKDGFDPQSATSIIDYFWPATIQTLCECNVCGHYLIIISDKFKTYVAIDATTIINNEDSQQNIVSFLNEITIDENTSALCFIGEVWAVIDQMTQNEKQAVLWQGVENHPKRSENLHIYAECRNGNVLTRMATINRDIQGHVTSVGSPLEFEENKYSILPNRFFDGQGRFQINSPQQ